MLCVWVLFIFSKMTFVSTQEKFDIRLANTTRYSDGFIGGRVEVRPHVSGQVLQWGTICDMNWHNRDAEVICRMLGFNKNERAKANRSGFKNGQYIAPFGAGTGPIWLHDVDCRQRHYNLRDCHRPQLNTSSCSHDRDAGVTCFNDSLLTTTPSSDVTTTLQTIIENDQCKDPNHVPNVRLRSFRHSPAGVGLVEILNKDTQKWSRICDDMWDIEAARVVCRMLCLNEQNALPGANSRHIGQYSNETSTFLAKFKCAGNENDLYACSDIQWSADCSDNEAAAVSCQHDNQVDQPPKILLSCQDRNMTAVFYQTSTHELTLNEVLIRNCTTHTKVRRDNSIIVSIPYDDCTEMSFNGTHINYLSTVDVSAKLKNYQVIRNPYIYKFLCSFPRNATVDKGAVIPQPQVIEHSATGKYKFTMQLYKDRSFNVPITSFPVAMKVGEWVNVGVILTNEYSNVKLIVDNCKATPSGSNIKTQFDLIKNKCPDKQVTLFPLNRQKFTFNFKTFKFSGNNDQLFIQCDAIVCHVTEGSAACDQTCSSKRTKRSARYIDDHFVYTITSPGPIVIEGDIDDRGVDDSLEASKNKENLLLKRYKSIDADEEQILASSCSKQKLQHFGTVSFSIIIFLTMYYGYC